MYKVKLLHVSAHLGGGVGRVLSELARHRRSAGAPLDDAYVCLETPIDRRFAEMIAQHGATVVIAPSMSRLREMIAAADVVQLEWWHHPLLAKALNELGEFRARTVVWAHVSGLHYPVIPTAFADFPQAFALTTKASLRRLQAGPRSNILEVINSTGGFDGFARTDCPIDGPTRFGYIGSLNPAKLHPRLLEFVAEVDRQGFVLQLYGDPSVNPLLQAAADSRICLRGFTDKPAEALAGLDVIAYLLNPTHYGSTENALLEAMACGVVPIVLNNPVEAGIVRHGETGLVVEDPRTFAAAVDAMIDDVVLRRRLAQAAADEVRREYSVAKSAARLETVYRRIMEKPKAPVDFRTVFGGAPSEIFRSCLGDYAECFAPGNESNMRGERLKLPFLYERSKSSVVQFKRYFPGDSFLAHWAEVLSLDLASAR